MAIPPASEKDKAAIALYAEIMEEVKHRTFLIWRAVNGELENVPAQALLELCFLQTRMTCELIALACLVAHEDIPASQKLRKMYSAEEIMKQLGELHQDFYPRAVEQKFTEPKAGEPRIVELIPRESGFLTKPELIRLVSRCGEVLHRGSLRNLISGRSSQKADLSEVDGYLKKIGALLSVHYLARLDSKWEFHCVMRAFDVDQKVVVTLIHKSAQRVGVMVARDKDD
jgi:hypothetical protein